MTSTQLYAYGTILFTLGIAWHKQDITAIPILLGLAITLLGIVRAINALDDDDDIE